MSNFSKKGLRANKQRTGKESMKGVKAILAHLDMIANVMNYSSQYQVTEENFLELAKPLMGRELDHIEATVLKSKLAVFNQEEDVKEDQPTEYK